MLCLLKKFKSFVFFYYYFKKSPKHTFNTFNVNENQLLIDTCKKKKKKIPFLNRSFISTNEDGHEIEK